MSKLTFLRDAYAAQKKYKEHKNEGCSKRRVYLNFIAKEMNISYNHFLKLLKVDVSEYPTKAQEYYKKQRQTYDAYLDKRKEERKQ